MSPDLGAASSFEQLGSWSAWITGELPGCISFNLICGVVSLRPFAILPAAVAVAAVVAVVAVVACQMLALVRGPVAKEVLAPLPWHDLEFTFQSDMAPGAIDNHVLLRLALHLL